MACEAVLERILAADRRILGVSGRGGDRADQAETERRTIETHCEGRALRITMSLSAPDSGSQISPGRPRIWRTLASGSEFG
jgi:hypothetical protein